MAVKLKPFDAAKYLETDEDIADLVNEAMASGEPAFIANALGVAARARGMTQVARDAGVTREALYKALSPGGDPKLSTLLGVMKALGIKLNATPAIPAE